MTAADAHLQIGANTVTLQVAGGEAAVMPIDTARIAASWFRHDPPSPGELEAAIEVVEDAIMGMRLPSLGRRRWVVEAPALQWVFAATTGKLLDLEVVEALFQRLTSLSLGDPSALRELPPGGEAAAALVILRECMHHLHFDSVTQWV